MDIKDFKTFESEHKGMDVNGIINMLDTLQKMSIIVETLKSTKPNIVRKNIISFLSNNDGNLDDDTVQKIQYIAQVWSDAFEGNEIIYGLKRRIDPIVKKLKELK